MNKLLIIVVCIAHTKRTSVYVYVVVKYKYFIKRLPLFDAIL